MKRAVEILPRARTADRRALEDEKRIDSSVIEAISS